MQLKAVSSHVTNRAIEKAVHVVFSVSEVLEKLPILKPISDIVVYV
jgi:hypothetical protein